MNASSLLCMAETNTEMCQEVMEALHQPSEM